MKQLQEQIDHFDQLLAQHAWQDQRVRLLMTLPGVDVTVAEAVLAALGDITRFTTPQQAASYLGLVPSTRQSAAKCYHGPITKQGNVQARWMLVQAAQQLGRHPGPLGNFFRRLKRRKNHNVAVVACARKLVIIAMHMLKNNEPYRYAQPATTETQTAQAASARHREKCVAAECPKGKKRWRNCREAVAPSRAWIASTTKKDCPSAGNSRGRKEDAAANRVQRVREVHRRRPSRTAQVAPTDETNNVSQLQHKPATRLRRYRCAPNQAIDFWSKSESYARFLKISA